LRGVAKQDVRLPKTAFLIVDLNCAEASGRVARQCGTLEIADPGTLDFLRGVPASGAACGFFHVLNNFVSF